MRTLLITDLHLNSKVPGLLEAQKQCLINIFAQEDFTDVIIMGDIFMHRKPSPSELLACRHILDALSDVDTVILRGNHDSETKADDGVTALSVFDSINVHVVTQTFTDKLKKRVFIPHYENEKIIKDALDEAPEGYTVFGHFGYRGALNSAGDADFDLRLSDFSNRSFLGHVHGYVQKKNVTVLGTPYTTNFGEVGKVNYYAILEGTRETYKPVKTGPRHLLYAAKDIEENLDLINDPNWFTMLRVTVDADHHPIPYDKLEVASVDVKYIPVFNEDNVSDYKPERDLFSINEVIIEDYVEAANSNIPYENLMSGYRLLKDED
jgi:DNA repair exonuclease SbcCD nuclease subunit